MNANIKRIPHISCQIMADLDSPDCPEKNKHIACMVTSYNRLHTNLWGRYCRTIMAIIMIVPKY